MTATRRAADLLILAIAFLAFWQALNALVGSTALPGPAALLLGESLASASDGPALALHSVKRLPSPRWASPSASSISPSFRPGFAASAIASTASFEASNMLR